MSTVSAILGPVSTNKRNWPRQTLQALSRPLIPQANNNLLSKLSPLGAGSIASILLLAINFPKAIANETFGTESIFAAFSTIGTFVLDKLGKNLNGASRENPPPQNTPIGETVKRSNSYIVSTKQNKQRIRKAS